MPYARDDRLQRALAPLLLKLPGVKFKDDGHAFTVPTVVGVMHVRVCDDFVACQFLGDLDAVQSRLNDGRHDNGRLSRPSGKWNWHLWDIHVDGVKANTAGEFPAKLMRRAAPGVRFRRV